ncbi:hypothetical protein CIN_03240 [Commensalibacter intestini A911]|uniref:Uncharacterized protein n=1 Tax=Commensalibacter intestini A911 TaxID=1088868 RepID=G6EY04_9PROT|nr:hypothetical protein [Commensalibacter intestini]EHD14392.1 hypothetical protein CIN_03240 [Commensalibacter intestini A911]
MSKTVTLLNNHYGISKETNHKEQFSAWNITVKVSLIAFNKEQQ